MHAEVSANDEGRIEVRFSLEPGEPLRTSAVPGLADALRDVLPGLDRHTCTSQPSGVLAAELPDTELAHVFEHVTLELMVLSGSPRALSGSTDWDFAKDGAGVFRVTLEHDDAYVAAGAVGEALALLEALLAGLPAPDPTDAATRLAALRHGAEEPTPRP